MNQGFAGILTKAQFNEYLARQDTVRRICMEYIPATRAKAVEFCTKSHKDLVINSSSDRKWRPRQKVFLICLLQSTSLEKLEIPGHKGWGPTLCRIYRSSLSYTLVDLSLKSVILPSQVIVMLSKSARHYSKLRVLCLNLNTFKADYDGMGYPCVKDLAVYNLLQISKLEVLKIDWCRLPEQSELILAMLGSRKGLDNVSFKELTLPFVNHSRMPVDESCRPMLNPFWKFKTLIAALSKNSSLQLMRYTHWRTTLPEEALKFFMAAQVISFVVLNEIRLCSI